MSIKNSWDVKSSANPQQVRHSPDDLWGGQPDHTGDNFWPDCSLIDTLIGVAGRERDVEPLEQHEHVVPAADHGVQRRAQQAPVPPEQDHAGDLWPRETHRESEAGNPGKGEPLEGGTDKAWGSSSQTGCRIMQGSPAPQTCRGGKRLKKNFYFSMRLTNLVSFQF